MLTMLGLSAAIMAATQGGQDAQALDHIQVTATRRAEQVFKVPTATSVIDAEEIARNAPAVMADHLRAATGVFVQRTTPGQATPVIRGFKGSEVLHLVDGFRLNNAFFRNAPNQYFGLIDPVEIERIEVVRGPSSTLYGSDAMGGVVQVLTPEPELSAEGTELGGHVVASLSSAELMRSGHGAVELRDTRVALRLSMTEQNFGGLKPGDDRERLPFTAFDQRGAAIKLVAEPVEGQQLMLQSQFFEQPSSPRHDALVPGFGQVNPETIANFFEPNHRAFWQLRYRFDAGIGPFDSAEFHLGRQHIRDDRRTRDFGSFTQVRERNASELRGLSGFAYRDFGPLQWTLGFEWYQDEVESQRRDTDVRSGVTVVRTSRFPTGSQAEQAALYSTADWQPNERLDINGGLRWTDFTVDLPPADRGVGVEVNERDLSGHIGGRYSLREDLNLVANLGRGFRAPNIFDLGTVGPRPGNRFNLPNPELAPETVLTSDLGLKFSNARTEAEFFLFHTRYEDKIASVLTGNPRADGRIEVQSRNLIEATLRGAEAGLRHRFREDLSGYLTATYTRGDEETASGETPADRIPPLQGKAGLIWQSSPALEWEAYAFLAGNQDRLSPRDAVDPRINPRGTPGFATANLRLSWVPLPDWRLSLRYENLGDKFYREHGSGYAMPGRNATATLEWRW